MAHTRVKLKNAESSIAFIQEQHAKTLEGLHQEIQKLQKKNARLTFELAMKGSSGASSTSSCTECKHLGEELISSKAEVLRLLSALSAREERSSLLGHQLTESEKKFAAEVKNREDKIGQLSAELESKADTVAYLTQQLHQSKLRLKKALEKHPYAAPTHTAAVGDAALQPGRSSASTRPYQTSRVVRRTTSSPVPQEVAFLTSVSPEAKTMRHLPTPPYPPVRRASTPRRRKPDLSPGTSSSSSSSPRDLSESRELSTQPRPPSVSPRQQSGGSRTNLDPVRAQRHRPSPPDISDILQSQKSVVPVITKPTPPVLPPIQSDTCMHAERHCSAASLADDLPQSKSVDCYASSERTNTPSSRLRHYPQRHRHIVLAKSQGLSSAPSTLRVLRCGPRTLESEEKDTDRYTPGAAEGTLMVKENVNEKSQAWQQLHQHGAD